MDIKLIDLLKVYPITVKLININNKTDNNTDNSILLQISKHFLY